MHFVKKTSQLIQKTLFCNKKNILAIFICIILSSLLGLVTPVVYQKIIDSAIPDKRFDLLLLNLIILMFTPVLIVIVSSLKNFFSALLGDKITQELRKECFISCLRAEYQALEKNNINDVMNTITREAGKIGEIYITKDVITFCTELVSLCLILVTMFIYNIQLTLFCVVAFPVLLIISNIVSKKCQSIEYRLTQTLTEGQSFLNQVLRQIKKIKTSNGYEYETNKWRDWLCKYKKIRLQSSVSNNVNRFLLSELITGIVYGLIFFIGSLQVMNNSMNLGALVTFVAFVPKVYSSMKNILNIKISSTVVKNSIDKIDDILNLPKEINEERILGERIESISFNDVNFQYNVNNFGVNNISIKAHSNQIIGLIGVTGSGKTTIFDLLAKIYYPSEGSITANNVDINLLNTDWLRSKISIVTQDCQLFNSTIRENILYPSIKSDNINLIQILDILNLTKLVQRLPYGLDTEVGNDGMLLSGGERQRISIANMILKKSDIILLDEFTSALDAETERQINEYIFGQKNKIIFVITHRTYMLKRFDYIYYLENGSIVEHGMPLQLLNDPTSRLARLDKNTKY